jgi:hypothetical protein
MTARQSHVEPPEIQVFYDFAGPHERDVADRPDLERALSVLA